ncbi:N-acetylmuramoyl-L-alanine amidase [Roseibium polysiphoniae]|uniref:N-acetylmuramoyl-L-alanine amidase n=1 Tax=Roseibium polysiphoniae TaxID=2571221 RepID=A0ABR9CBH2_9HYPH|nr:N-acetylmuramoyl-L-alanine amidase [Roseibium polysiphoniae]MBD8876262.1 N-acetylmuramoyl-L-alanine amidase [Roseibium polysiphoniae]
MSVATDTGVTARVHPSPNHGERAPGSQIDMLILHYTGMQDGDSALRRLCDPRSEVSAHYFVYEDGSILQCVPESRRAWHAGKSSWQGQADINSRSIGVEIVNPGHEWGYRDFPDVQIEAVADLCADICRRHDIQPRMVLAHSDVAPGRKEDPGEKFPWASLALRRVGHYVEPAPITSGLFMQLGESGQPVEAVQSMLALYGYEVGISGSFDQATQAAVTAFQRHFRPAKVDGVVDQSTVETLHKLLSALPAL